MKLQSGLLNNCFPCKAAHFLSIIGIAFLLSSCAKIPIKGTSDFTKIEVDFGPEDFVLDTFSSAARLIIACDGRRENEVKSKGSIWQYRIDSPEATELERINEPDSLLFHPHGLDIVNNEAGTYLFIVSHDDAVKDQKEGKPKHWIYKYKLEEDKAVFKRAFSSALFTSPNAVVAQKDESFFVSNDGAKRFALFELMLALKKSKVIYCDGKDYPQYKIAAENIAMGNGILISETEDENRAYVAGTRHNRIFEYEIENNEFINRETIAKLKGPDNLRFYNGGILVASHLNLLKFMKHRKKKENKSPTTIYRVKTKQGSEVELIYGSDGSEISAGSTGIVFKKRLYIAQVFDPFILSVPFSEE